MVKSNGEMEERDFCTEGQYVQHCENPTCDLGYFEYTCPSCKWGGTNFDEAWWERDEIYNGKQVKFDCEHCNKELIVFCDKENMEYLVRLP
jgi:hypothetical protein